MVFVYTLLTSANSLAADQGCAVPAQEWDEAAAAHQLFEVQGGRLSEAEREDINADWLAIKSLYDGIINETAPVCQERRDFVAKDAEHVAKQQDLTARINAHNADPNRTDDDAAALNAEQAALDQELADLQQWATDLNQRIDEVNKYNLTQYTAFTQKVQAAFNAKHGFTGKKTVQLTAKSWINGATLPLLTSIKGIMLRMDPNQEPQGPALSPDADDFKLYQTFTAEVEFEDGKVVAARFLEDWLDLRADNTFAALPGLIYVRESKISDWHGQDSVTFTRSVAGRPNILLSEGMELFMDEAFQDIWSTLVVEITGDKVIPHGYGSDFPSHKFWMDEQPLPEKLQVAPAEYFK